jgi:hypothetical protein
VKQFLFAPIDGLECLILAALKAVWFVIEFPRPTISLDSDLRNFVSLRG